MPGAINSALATRVLESAPMTARLAKNAAAKNDANATLRTEMDDVTWLKTNRRVKTGIAFYSVTLKPSVSWIIEVQFVNDLGNALGRRKRRRAGQPGIPRIKADVSEELPSRCSN